MTKIIQPARRAGKTRQRLLMQLPRVANRSRKQPFDVYIGRPSRWGNPFTHRPEIARGRPDMIVVPNREAAVQEYRRVLVYERQLLLTRLPALFGKTLGCWCKPEPCHGDVLVEMAELYLEGGICSECGCTENNACFDEDRGPCWWIRPGLCSHCCGPTLPS